MENMEMYKMHHNKIIKKLEDRIKEHHPNALWEHEFEYDLRCNHKHGECDLWMIDSTPKRTYAYVIEVKTNDSWKNHAKAHQQILKDFKFMKENYNPDVIYGFYAYSKGKKDYIVELDEKWRKNV